MSSDITGLEERLDAPIDFGGITDRGYVRGTLGVISNSVRKVRDYFGGWRPGIRGYRIRNLEPGTAASYQDGIVNIDHRTLNDPRYAEHAVVHELVHDKEHDSGSVFAYTFNFVKEFGEDGYHIATAFLEGVADYFAQKISNLYGNGYPHWNAGATEVVKDHSEHSLLNPVYITRNWRSMLSSFKRGLENFTPNTSHSAYA